MLPSTYYLHRYIKIICHLSETHDGVQDMACDTFIKIAQKCRRHFVTIQVGEVMPFIEEMLNGINTIICDLQPQQVIVIRLPVFDAVKTICPYQELFKIVVSSFSHQSIHIVSKCPTH